MRTVVDRNVVMRRITVPCAPSHVRTKSFSGLIVGWSIASNRGGPGTVPGQTM